MVHEGGQAVVAGEADEARVEGARGGGDLRGRQIRLRQAAPRARTLVHAGKRREHAACFAKACVAMSVLMLVMNIGVLRESVGDMARPLHWSELLRLSVLPLHGGCLAMIPLAYWRRQRHHGGSIVRGGRASYRAWREIDVSFTLIFSTACFFQLDLRFGESPEPSSFTAVLAALCAAATWIFLFIVLRAKVVAYGMCRHPWLRRVR
jgi:hypothetical protein